MILIKLVIEYRAHCMNTHQMEELCVYFVYIKLLLIPKNFTHEQNKAYSKLIFFLNTFRTIIALNLTYYLTVIEYDVIHEQIHSILKQTDRYEIANRSHSWKNTIMHYCYSTLKDTSVNKRSHFAIIAEYVSRIKKLLYCFFFRYRVFVLE